MGRLKILKPLSNRIVNKKKIYAFDIETQQSLEKRGDLEYKKQKFLMGSVVGYDVREVFWDKYKMQKFLLTKKFRNNLIFATNLDFDFNMLYDDFNLSNFNFVERNGSFIIISLRKYKIHQWKFLDTLNYSKVGVERLGEMLNIRKEKQPAFLGNKPSSFAEKEELERYNLKDSFISYKFGEFMLNFCNKIKCKLKPTIASIGIDYWRRNYLKQDIFQERKEIIDQHFQGSIKGGRTENFKRGLFNDIYYYDFNSMYPSVCKDGINNKGSYPDPSSVRTLSDATVDYIESFDGISEVELEAPDLYIPLLGCHDKNGKLFFPKGKLKGWWCNIELRKALELGYKINKVFNIIYYDKYFVPFKDCVKTLYDLRMSYRREGNIPMEMMIKTLMNGGLFGKFAQKLNNRTNCYHIKSFFVEKDGKCYIQTEDKKIFLEDFNIRGNYVFENIEIPVRIPVFILPILASYTTAMARLKLFRYMNKNAKEMIYCDTDSLVVNRRLYENSTILGKLKLECKIKEGIFCRPKQYYYNDGKKDIVKIKGVIRSLVYNKDSFMDILRTGAKYQRFTKTKESSIRKIPYGSIIIVNKFVNLEDNKRIWLDKFSFDSIQDSKALSMIGGLSELDYERERLKVELKYNDEQRKLFDEKSELFEERFSDFFDSMGEDISREEFYERESEVVLEDR